VKHAGKVVVVTGAGSGIGRATALAFAAEGARVAACDVAEDRLASLRAELGERALLVERVDVSNRAQMAAFAAAVHAKVPAADVVVNNAGVGVGGEFLDISLDDWDWLLGVNLRGVIHGCHFFLPKMVERGAGGQVVNVSSILGIHPAPTLSAYVASKFAVLGMSQSLRAELAPKRIGVTAICPGMIATSIVDDGRTSEALRASKEKMSALYRRRGAKPELVARAILEAVEKNPAIRTVGRDAWVIHAMTRIAPRTAAKLGAKLTSRLRGD
jgi:NADP-dependent 3-hydroxy acid dehydrogenase YdfG